MKLEDLTTQDLLRELERRNEMIKMPKVLPFSEPRMYKLVDVCEYYAEKLTQEYTSDFLRGCEGDILETTLMLIYGEDILDWFRARW